MKKSELESMTLADMKERLATLDKLIKDAIVEKSKLTNAYLEKSDNFLDKFKVWFNTAKENSPEQWIPSKVKYPLFRNYLDDFCHCEKYASYSIEDLLEDELYAVFNYDECVEEESKLLVDKEIEEITPILKELMSNNLFYFKYDW